MQEIELDIEEKEFKKLNSRTQITILYRNIREVKSLIQKQNELIENLELKGRFNIKVIFAWLSALTAGIGAIIGIKFI